MSFHLRIILIAGSILFCIAIFNMLRKDKVEFKYVLTWIISALSLLSFALYPQIAIKISNILGIAVPSNAVFLICICFLLLIVFVLTISISKLSNNLRALSQDFSILKQKYESSENKK